MVGSLINTLDQPLKMGLIVSIIEESKALTTPTVLTVSAILVPIDEVEIFDPSQADPGESLEIKRIPTVEDTVWKMA